jgi:hypothetical protein
MPRGTERRLLVRRPESKLVEIGLADDDRAGAPERGDGRRVVLGNMMLADARGRTGGRSANVEQVLDRYRDAVQRSGRPAGLDVAVGFACLLARLVCENGDEGVQQRVAFRDPREASLDDGFRRGLPGLQRTRQLRNVCGSAAIVLRRRVELSARVRVPFRGAQRGRRLGERFEQRPELRKAPALCVLNGDFEPGLDGHLGGLQVTGSFCL